MAVFRDNPGQKQAIETDGAELLISASAGTGKTSTLCRRILKKVTEGEAPSSLDRLLVVTFTNASAADMRRKLGETLREALGRTESGEKKRRIREQMKLLPLCRIGTIDSYCYELVREHFDLLNLSPKIRIADDVELYKTKISCMRRAMEKMYRENALFPETAGSFLSSYSDKELCAVLVALYEKIENTSKGLEALSEQAADYEQAASLPFEEGKFGRYFLQRNRLVLSYFLEEYTAFERELDGRSPEEKGVKKCTEICRAEKEAVKELLEHLRAPSYMQEVLDRTEFEKLASMGEDPAYIRFKEARDLFKDYMKSYKNALLDFNFKDRQRILEAEGQMHRCLKELLEIYREDLWEKKRAAGVLEFSDIERLSKELLLQGEEKTPLAQELGASFDEVYIDEYQDVNQLQNDIFKALSKNNRFVVGDVKQSIYGFRGACPEIFSELRESYPPVEEGKRRGRVFFDLNYRCQKKLIAFINEVCGKLLSLCSDMRYHEQDNLRSGKDEEEESGSLLPQICLVTGQEELAKGKHAEAMYTAKSIAALLKQGTKGEDIALLLRNMTGAPLLAAALDQMGVPYSINCRKGFFECPEVLLLRCLLESIHNPTKDIYLAGALKSPVFGFTLDDLYRVKKGREKRSLYGALQDYAETTGEEKAAKALRFLSGMRKMAKEAPVDKLVYTVLGDCMLLPLLSKGQNAGRATEIQDNLLYFYDLVRIYSMDGKADLGRVLGRISDMAERNVASDGKSGEPEKGKVQIMTVHASKGLEFPVCWLYGCGKSLGGGRLQTKKYSSAYGQEFRVKNPDYPGIYDRSEADAVICAVEKEKAFNEETRLLYVALTRAKSKLFVSAQVSRSRLAQLESYRENGVHHRYPLEQNFSVISMILGAVGGKAGLYEMYIDQLPAGLEEAKSEIFQEEQAEILPDPRLEKEMRDRLSYVYPYKASTELPAKKAVSLLTPTVLDEGGEALDMLAEWQEPTVGEPIKPAFILEAERGQKRPTPAERGTATHAFLQFCEFEYLEKEGFEQERKRLVERAFLSAPVADMVEREPVEAFMKSGLYKRMRRSAESYREQRFLIALPAVEFTAEEEKRKALAGEELLVQGVIDGFFLEKDGKVVLFDYKTDHFSKEELKDPQACGIVLAERYRKQLFYYREAVTKMLDRPVDECYLYSFALRQAVPVFFED